MRKKHYDTAYYGHPINQSTKCEEGCYEEILERAKDLLDFMTSRHNRVFMTTFVLKYPPYSTSHYPQDNSLLTAFLESFKLDCKRSGYPAKHLWVRESSKETGNFHYHVMMLFDYDLIYRAYPLLQKASMLWQSYLNVEGYGGYVELCSWPTTYDQYGGVKIMKNDPSFPQAYNRCFEQASYMAKCYSKGDLPPYVKGFGSSQLS